MTSMRFRSNLLVVASLILVFAALASAQASRTWVSGVGDDANPCSRTAPCKTFAGAISKTAQGGEIDCLDPGGFGALTITKSITIDCDSGVGSVLVSGTNGIVVAAGVNDVIYIKNLNINGILNSGNPGLNGVKFQSGKALELQEVDIFGFSGSCVDIETTNNSTVVIEHSQLSNCNTAGVFVNTAVGFTSNVDIHDTHIWNISPTNNTGSGILANNGSRIDVRDCVISNSGFGIQVSSLSGNASTTSITGSTVALTQTAFQALGGGGGGFISVSANNLISNGLVFNPNGGTVQSAGDNINFGNGATGASSAANAKI